MKRLWSILVSISVILATLPIQMNTVYAAGTVTGISGSSTGYDEMSVSWDAFIDTDTSTPADSYDVSLSDGGGSKSVSGTSTTFSGLQANTTYTITVVAYAASVEIGSGSGSGTTADFPDPTTPAGLGVSGLGTTSATVSWTASDYTDSYDVDGAGVNTNTTNTSYDFTSLDPGTSYSVDITAVRGTKTSSPASISFTTDLDSPTVSISNITENSADVNWGPVDGADEYEVTVASIPYSNTVSTPGDSLSGLVPNTSYTVNVVAKTTDKTSGTGSAGFTTSLPEPGTPANVSTSGITQTEASVSWDSVSYADIYDVYLGGTKVGDTSSTSYNFSLLTPDTDYSGEIVATNASGSSTGAAFSFRTKIPAPDAPTGLSVTGITQTSANIGWNASSYAEDYTLTITTGGSQVIDTTIASTSFSATTLEPATSYIISVVANNAEGTSSAASDSFTTSTPLPGMPVLGAETGITESSASISWSSVQYADSYDVRLNGLFVINTASTSYTFSDLDSATSYGYSVTAVNETGDGGEATGVFTTLQPLPSQPTGLSISSVTTTGATVSWTASANAENYRIEVDGDTYTTSSTSQVISGLNPESTYNVSVYGTNARGDSTPATTSFTTLTPVPNAPGSVTASAITDVSATISWASAQYADSYTVSVDGRTFEGITSTSLEITGLNPVTEYTANVTSINGSGSGGPSSVTFTTIAPPPPTIPTGLSGSGTIDTISVNWNSSDGAVDYTLEINGGTLNNSTTVSGTSHTFTDLDPTTDYDIRVRANGQYGSSEFSSWTRISTLTPPPDTPTGVNAVAGITEVTISWTSVEDADTYDVTLGGISFNTAATEYTFTDLDSETVYLYRVRANNIHGSSPYSESKSVKTKVELPEPPSSVNLTSSETELGVSWTASERATSYDVSLDGVVYNTESTSMIFSELPANTLFSVKVRGKNATGDGEYTSVYEKATLQYMPEVPTGVQSNATEYEATISWTAVDYANSYTVSFDGGTFETKDTVWTKGSLEPWTEYTYSVRANNERGSSDYSAEKTIRTLQILPDTPGGISATSTSRSVTVTWNPVDIATGYEVLFNGRTYPTSNNSLTIDRLRPDTTYDYAVRSQNQAGYSDYSEIKRIRTDDVTPSQPYIDEISSTETTISISWSLLGNADYYDVEFSGDLFSTTNTTMTFTDLQPDSSYSIRVRGVNDIGNGAFSTIETIFTDEEIALTLPVPSGVEAVITSNSVTVSWDALDGAASYEVSMNGKIVSTTGLSYMFTGLDSNTTYEYMVRGVNNGGVGLFSQLKNIRTRIGKPGKVTGITATVTENQAFVTWEELSSVESYEVLIDGETFEVEDNSFTWQDLEADEEYALRIRGSNEEGVGIYSDTYTFRTSVTIPDQPTGIRGSTTSSTITLSWNSVDQAAYYQVNVDGRVIRSSRSFITITGLDSNTVYSYAVRAVNDAGASQYTSTATITTEKRVAPIVVTAPLAGNMLEVHNDDLWTIKWNRLDDVVSYTLVVTNTNTNKIIIDTVTADVSFVQEGSSIESGDHRISIQGFDNVGDLIGEANLVADISKRLSGVYPVSTDVTLDESNQFEIGFESVEKEDILYRVILFDVVSGEELYNETDPSLVRQVDGDLFTEDPTNIRLTIEALEGLRVIADYTTDIRVFAKLNQVSKPSFITSSNLVVMPMNGTLDLEWTMGEENIPSSFELKVIRDGVLVFDDTLRGELTTTLNGTIFNEAGRYIVALVGHKFGFESSKPEYMIVQVLEKKEVNVETMIPTTKSFDRSEINGKLAYLNKERIKVFGFEYGTNQLMEEKVDVAYIKTDGSYSYNLRGLEAGTKYYYRAFVKLLDGSTKYGQVLTMTVPVSDMEKPEVLELSYKANDADPQSITYTIVTDITAESVIIDNQQGGLVTYRQGYVEFDNTKIWTIQRYYRRNGIYQERISAHSINGYSHAKSVNIVTDVKSTTQPLTSMDDRSYEFFIGTNRMMALEGMITAQGSDRIKNIKYVIESDNQVYTIVDEAFNDKMVDLSQVPFSSGLDVFKTSGQYIIKVFASTEIYGEIEVSLDEVIILVKSRVETESISDTVAMYEATDVITIQGQVKSMDGALIDNVVLNVGSEVIEAYKKPWLPIGRTSLVDIEESIELENMPDGNTTIEMIVTLDSGYTYSKLLTLYESRILIEVPDEIGVGDYAYLRVYQSGIEGDWQRIDEAITLLSDNEAVIRVEQDGMRATGSGSSRMTIEFSHEGKKYQKYVTVNVED